MRHRRRRGKLARPAAHRIALMRNLVTSLLDHELIETTDPRAKELKRFADRMITLGKRGDLHARRQASAVIQDRAVVTKLFGDLAERYAKRPGGYTRVLKSRLRVGDAAPLSIIELVDRAPAGAPAKPEPGKKKAAEKEKAPEKKARAKKTPEKKSEKAAAPKKKAPRKKKAAG